MSGRPFSRQGRRGSQGDFDGICLVVFLGGSVVLLAWWAIAAVTS